MHGASAAGSDPAAHLEDEVPGRGRGRHRQLLHGPDLLLGRGRHRVLLGRDGGLRRGRGGRDGPAAPAEVLATPTPTGAAIPAEEHSMPAPAEEEVWPVEEAVDAAPASSWNFVLEVLRQDLILPHRPCMVPSPCQPGLEPLRRSTVPATMRNEPSASPTGSNLRN